MRRFINHIFLVATSLFLVTGCQDKEQTRLVVGGGANDVHWVLPSILKVPDSLGGSRVRGHVNFELVIDRSNNILRRQVAFFWASPDSNGRHEYFAHGPVSASAESLFTIYQPWLKEYMDLIVVENAEASRALQEDDTLAYLVGVPFNKIPDGLVH